MEKSVMTGNPLRLHVGGIDEAKTGLEYCYRIIAYIHSCFPKGYVEWRALCRKFYGPKAERVLERLKCGRVELDKPICMEWNKDYASTFVDLIVFPLCFVFQCQSFEALALFGKAFERFVMLKEEGV